MFFLRLTYCEYRIFSTAGQWSWVVNVYLCGGKLFLNFSMPLIPILGFPLVTNSLLTCLLLLKFLKVSAHVHITVCISVYFLLSLIT